MTRQELLELLNKELDGTILPAEAELLKADLSRDPQAQEIRSELWATVGALEALPMVDPPRSLKPAIFRAIQDDPKAMQRPVRRPLLSPLLNLLRGGTRLGYAYAFTGGVAAGVLILVLFLNVFNGSPFDDSSASGTLAMAGERLSLNLEQVKGYILTEHSNTSNSLTLRLNSEGDISVRIIYDPNAVRFEGARALQNPETQLSVRTGEVEIAGSGSMGYRIAFAGSVQSAPPVQIRMYSSGQLIYDHSISIDRGGR